MKQMILCGIVMAAIGAASVEAKVFNVVDYRNTHHVTVSGRHAFSIAQMNTEHPGAGQTDEKNDWQRLVSDVEDPNNLGTGEIHYWVVEGNVGAVETFTCRGGTSIRARRIGSSPSP